uniref:Plant resistance protein n=1 Tax=Solanum tuberosum TaxID=4113 RepID=M1CEA6_SOLTU
MSDGPLFMHLLHRHLNDLLDSNAYSIALIKEEIGLVKQDLEFIRFFFVNDEQELYKDLWAHVLDVAYEAKDVIDSIIVRDNGLLHLIFSLPITIKKINLIKEDISNLLEKIPKDRSLIVVNSPKKSVESKSLTTGKIIVGFEEETNWIIRKLTSGPADLDVISITGMPGSGKTTLAYKVYNDKSVSSHFDLRAWCTVGQEYDEKKLLHKIFNQVSDLDSKLSENIDVADMLRKQLFGKRYLIVIDDVWDTTTWVDLTRPFPTVEKGSRIILTTRELEVALHGKRTTDPLNLRLLRPEESWELFEKRAFGKESCPDELLNVGKELAQNCKGLPLVADLIAGVVARKEKKKTVWLEVRNNLSSFILNSEVEVMKVIELSYDHIPNHLKPCFLYLARFPKDSPMIILALKDFWRAEGLVEQTEMKSVEEVMDVYLDNLISSSLVFLFNEIGDHPTCRLHDLVHDFCLMKARKEKLFDRISSSAPPSSSDLMPRIVTIDCNSEFFLLNNFVLFGSNKIRHSGKHLYSLRIIGDKLDDRLSDICHLRHLRLLRVLYLDPSFIKVKDSLLNEICMLNHLRFLCIGTEVKSLPTSLSNLWNLETLLVSNIGSTLVLLPRIWDLVKLRVLFMSACSFFDLNSDEPILIAEDTKLENLRQLENLELSYSKDAEDIFKRFPNLQGLAFRLKESWDYSTEGYWFPKLDFLTELEDLRIVFESSNTNDSGPSVATNRPWDFHFPASLKSLWLGVFPLSSDSLSIIARLPNLENLTLKNTIIQGEEWNMGEEDTFENLKFLELDEVALAKWEVGEESFAVLEKLVLWRCRKLDEIPPSFGDIYSLKIIKVDYNRHLKDSAMMIKQYVEDMTGEDKLQVHCLLKS